MTDNSIRFFDELISENNKLNHSLKNTQDDKEIKNIEKQLLLNNNLIKYVSKYNNSKIIRIVEPSKKK